MSHHILLCFAVAVFLAAGCASNDDGVLNSTSDATEAGLAVVMGDAEPEFSAWQCKNSKVMHMRFSPTDEHFSVVVDPIADAQRDRLLVIERSSGRTVIEDEGWVIHGLTFDRGGACFAACIGRYLVLYDLATGLARWELGREFIFEGKSFAMGFSDDGESLVLFQYDGGFSYAWTSAEHLTLSVADGTRNSPSTSAQTFWYGGRLSTDGNKCWSCCGWPGPTPCVFDSELGFMAQCLRIPNICGASFARDGNSLITLHTDGALLRWDLTTVDEDGQADIAAKTMEPDLLNAQTWAPLNTEDAIAMFDDEGKLVKIPYPK